VKSKVIREGEAKKARWHKVIFTLDFLGAERDNLHNLDKILKNYIAGTNS